MPFSSNFSYDDYPSMDFETHQHSYEQETVWNSLDKFLEWKQNQPEFSSPESPLSDSDPTPTFYHQAFKIDNRVSLAKITPVAMSPARRIPSPQNLATENVSFPLNGNPTLYPPPGPQLPRIGRPRSTPTTLSTQNDEAGKAPTQAKRRSQNREAQRAFRLRQKQYIEQIAIENKELIAKNEELEARCEMLAKAYHRVLGANTRMGGVGLEQGRSGGEFGMAWMRDGPVSKGGSEKR